MAFTPISRVLETGSGSGTGNVTLLGAQGSGEYDAFNERLSVTDTTFYVIVDGSSFEIGYGTYSAATPSNGTFTRDTVIRSSSGTSKISLSGSNFNIFGDIPPEKVLVVGPSGAVTNVTAVAAAVLPKDAASLKALDEPADNTIVGLGYNTTEGDGLGGFFRWDDTSTATADDVHTFELDAIGSSPGRFIRERQFLFLGEAASDPTNDDAIMRRSDTHDIKSKRTDTGVKLIPQLENAHQGEYTTFATWKALASTKWKANDTFVFRGITEENDLGGQYLVFKWDASSTNTTSLDVTHLRPDDISGSNPGRAILTEPAAMSKFTNSDATPSMATGRFHRCADTVPAAITALDDMVDLQPHWIFPGAADQVFTHGASLLCPNGVDFTLYTNSPPVMAVSDNGIVSIIGGGVLPTVPNVLAETTLTLSTGSATGARAAHIIAAESGTTDDFDTFDMSAYPVGAHVRVRADSGDTITIKNGTGNITTDTGSDITLDSVAKYATLTKTAGGVNATLAGSLAIGTIRPINVREYGAALDASINTAGTLSGTDDATAIQAAVDAAATYGGAVLIDGPFRLDSQIDVPANVMVMGLNRNWAGPVFDVSTGGGQYVNCTSVVCFVNFGSGTTTDATRSNCAFRLSDGSAIEGISFWYPGQDMSETGTASTTFPAAIGLADNTLHARVEYVNFGNSYVGVDAFLDHKNCTFKNLRGYPISAMLRIGDQADVDYVSDVHVHPFWSFIGTGISSSTSCIDHISAQMTALYLGAQSWTVYHNIFVYGANKGVDMIYQTGTTNGDRGCQNLRFVNCGFDSCYYGIYSTHGASTGQAHFGCVVESCHFASLDAYDATRVNGIGIYWDQFSVAAQSDIQIVGGTRFHSCIEDAISINNAKGCTISDDVHFISWGTDDGGYAVRLNNTQSCRVGGHYDFQATTNREGIYLESTNTECVISGRFEDITSTGVAIRIDNSSNGYYTIANCAFEKPTGSEPIVDSQLDPESYIDPKSVVWDNFSENLSNSNLSSNILQLPLIGEFFRFTDTGTPIYGISDNRKGRFARIMFTNSSPPTIHNDQAGVGEAVIHVRPSVNDYTPRQYEMVDFMCESTRWGMVRDQAGFASSQLTISTGGVTATARRHTIETEGGAGTDDLANIFGGVDGMELLISAADTTHTVVVKHGSGNIYTRSAADVSLDSTEVAMKLVYIGAISAWVEF